MLLLILAVIIVITSRRKAVKKGGKEREEKQSELVRPAKEFLQESSKELNTKSLLPSQKKLLQPLNLIVAKRKPEIISGTTNKTLYPYDITCSKNNCTAGPGDRQVALPVLLANLQAYGSLNFEPALKLAEEDFEFIKDQRFQPDHLHCVYWELIENKGFLKGDFKKLCQQGIYLFYPQISAYSEKIDIHKVDVEKIKDLLEGRVVELLSGLPLPENDWDFSLYSAYAYDFARRYFYLNSPSSLYLARGYFDLAIYYWVYNRQKEKSLKGKVFLPAAAFTLWKATGAKEYDDLGFYLAQKAMAAREGVEELLNSLFLDEVLLERTGQERYKKDILNVLEYLEKYFVDKNGLWRADVDGKRYYYTRDNALFSYFKLKWER